MAQDIANIRKMLILATESVKDGLTIRQACDLHKVKYKPLYKFLARMGVTPLISHQEYRRSLKNAKGLKRLIAKSPKMPPEGMKVCVFCRRPQEREAELGKFHIKSKVSVHYYCLLFSCALEQNGEDDEGILGFLQKDILREVQRGRKLKCIYCMKSGATIGCNNKCRASYHFPCGLDHNAQFVFSDDFSSFCKEHREVQSKIKLPKGDCPICLDTVKQDPLVSVYTPCCKKSWFHKLCLQKLALSAGYFFKCPLCNDKAIFVKEMLRMGVYVPEQDASWEKEPNAFADLLERHIHCDAPKCGCSGGRDKDGQGTLWEIILCSLCGSTGTHLKCAKLRMQNKTWECPQCVEMLKNSKRTRAHQTTPKEVHSFFPRKRRSRLRKNMGESSGLSSQSVLVEEDKYTLPSVDEIYTFAKQFPEILLDKGLQHFLQEILPNCDIDIFGNAIDQFCNVSLKEIQMLMLYQIYKPLSLWLALRKDSNRLLEPLECGKKSEVLPNFETLTTLIKQKLTDACKETSMEEFKISTANKEEKKCNDVIRYDNSLFSLNAEKGKSRNTLYTLIKDCQILLKPVSQQEIEQNVSLPTKCSISTSPNNIDKCIVTKSSIKISVHKNKKLKLSPVKENNYFMASSAKSSKSPTNTPLSEKCLNINTLFLRPPSPFLSSKPTRIPDFRKRQQKSKDSKKYIQLSISEFFTKK